MSELAERLEQAEARAAVADLVHTYARLIRHDRPDEVAALFLPDGWFEIREGAPDRPEFTLRERLAGAAQVHAYLAPTKGKPHPIPLIHNLIVEIDGDSAQANSVMEAQVFGTDRRVIGEYRDTARRVDGRWLFASRIYTIFSAASSV